MSVLYLEEHRACKHYSGSSNSSFKYFVLEKSSQFVLSTKEEYLFIFLLKGNLQLTCHRGIVYNALENTLSSLAYGGEFKGLCETDVEMIVLSFNQAQIKCDEFSFINLRRYLKEEDIGLCFNSLPMLAPIKEFLENLIFYLENKMYCKHLHDLKQSEWFFLMRAFYTKEQNAAFFAPLIEGKDNFILKVKQLSDSVSTVKELAEKCNMSTKTLTRNFHKHFNTTPKKWLLKQKKEEVRLHLLRTNNFKMIHNKLGFSSNSHLNSYCKKYFNRTVKEVSDNNDNGR